MTLFAQLPLTYTYTHRHIHTTHILSWPSCLAAESVKIEVGWDNWLHTDILERFWTTTFQKSEREVFILQVSCFWPLFYQATHIPNSDWTTRSSKMSSNLNSHPTGSFRSGQKCNTNPFSMTGNTILRVPCQECLRIKQKPRREGEREIHV